MDHETATYIDTKFDRMYDNFDDLRDSVEKVAVECAVSSQQIANAITLTDLRANAVESELTTEIRPSIKCLHGFKNKVYGIALLLSVLVSGGFLVFR